MSEEEQEHIVLSDTTGVERQKVDGYITNQIIIQRIFLTEDDGDRVFVDWPDESSMLELLGMIELAKSIILSYFHNQGEDDGDEDDD